MSKFVYTAIKKYGLDHTTATACVKSHFISSLTLDGDEVGTALVGDGLGQESLTAPRGSVEQRPLGSAHAEFLELVSVLHGVLVMIHDS